MVGRYRICTLNIYLSYFAVPAASIAPTHPSIKDSATVVRAPKAPAPLLWRRPKAASFMDGCVGAREAADAAKHA